MCHEVCYKNNIINNVCKVLFDTCVKLKNYTNIINIFYNANIINSVYKVDLMVVTITCNKL